MKNIPEIQAAFYSLLGAKDPVREKVREIEELIAKRKRITKAQAEFYMQNRPSDKQRGVEAAKEDILNGRADVGLTLPLVEVFGQEYADGYTEFVLAFKKMERLANA